MTREEVTREDAADGQHARPRTKRPSPTSATSPTDSSARALETELASVIEALGRHARRLVRNASGVATLAAKRLQLKFVDGALGVAVALLAFFVAIVGAVVAAVLVVLGLRDALADLTKRPWVGELGAGALVLVALFLGMRIVRSRARRSIVASAPMPDSHSTREREQEPAPGSPELSSKPSPKLSKEKP